MQPPTGFGAFTLGQRPMASTPRIPAHCSPLQPTAARRQVGRPLLARRFLAQCDLLALISGDDDVNHKMTVCVQRTAGGRDIVLTLPPCSNHRCSVASSFSTLEVPRRSCPTHAAQSPEPIIGNFHASCFLPSQPDMLTKLISMLPESVTTA
ncbi:hypothetical protein I7I53_10317 [Histoplasma capsulatum var. duboisii H88]|uniref:Uncharacterized protein n=1 Tax=Ajellomyces capsulatus (strain H88) TaxID=544711 RepID=A0A8A1L885_AJEC8|nr:hypothetical protein I7I53_10317 [Histoplasma capsulatum var. duboisii H88]